MCRPADTVGGKAEKDKARLRRWGAKINILCRTCYDDFAVADAYMLVAVIIASQDIAE